MLCIRLGNGAARTAPPSLPRNSLVFRAGPAAAEHVVIFLREVLYGHGLIGRNCPEGGAERGAVTLRGSAELSAVTLRRSVVLSGGLRDAVGGSSI